MLPVPFKHMKYSGLCSLTLRGQLTRHNAGTRRKGISTNSCRNECEPAATIVGVTSVLRWRLCSLFLSHQPVANWETGDVEGADVSSYFSPKAQHCRKLKEMCPLIIPEKKGIQGNIQRPWVTVNSIHIFFFLYTALFTA